MDVREKLVDLFYDSNVRCDQKIGRLADDVMDIIAHYAIVQGGEDNNVPTKWISVKDSLPENGERVLACGAKGGVFMVRATTTPGFGKVDGASNYRSFDYWMPLPQPPKGEQE